MASWHVGSVKTVSGIGPQFWLRKRVARPGRNCLPDAFGLVNREVAIELVDEEPTEEMISARERFWEKVFAELLLAKESSVKAKRKKQ